MAGSIPNRMTILVESLDGKKERVKVLDNWALKKFRVGVKQEYRTDKPYELFFNGRELMSADDGTILPQLGIKHESMVHLIFKITVKVQTMDKGMQISMTVLENWTLSKFRNELKNRTASAETNNVMLYLGKHLTDTEDGNTLKELLFVDGATVQLTTRSTGGWLHKI